MKITHKTLHTVTVKDVAVIYVGCTLFNAVAAPFIAEFIKSFVNASINPRVNDFSKKLQEKREAQNATKQKD